MEQRISFITLGVSDLSKMKSFYLEKLGWNCIKDENGIIFFKMNGFILSLFPSDELAKDIGIADDGNGFKRITLAINYDSEEQVNEAFDRLQSKGVNIILAPEKVFWGGYRGYFADPENNYWEIAYNPFLKLDTDLNVITHL